MDSGAKVDDKNDDGETALMRASYDGNTKEITFLIEKGANVQSCDNRGNTILHHACNYDGRLRYWDNKPTDFNVSVVEFIIKTGLIDINAKNFDGNTPLHFAAMKKNEKLIELLLASGADPNVTNNEGVTPLMILEQNHVK